MEAVRLNSPDQGDALPYRYLHHGLRLASWVELPDLAHCRLPDGTVCDISITEGTVPDDVELDEFGSRRGLSASNGSALLSYANLGRFLVTSGRQVVADLRPDADRALVHSCLLTAVMPILCHQRGLAVLHASAVAFGSNVVAFAGNSGAGKSTLAAHCLEAGAKLVADDILVASFSDDGYLVGHPGTSSLRLKSYALSSLGRSAQGLVRYGDEDKFIAPQRDRLVNRSLPLRRLYFLHENASAGSGDCIKLSGIAALTALVENAFGAQYLDALGMHRAHFSVCCRIAAATEIVQLSRQRAIEYLPATAAMIRDIAQRVST